MNIWSLNKARFEMSEQPIDKNSSPQCLDYDWVVTGTNWFLISVGLAIKDSIHAGGYPGGVTEFSGRLVGALLATVLFSAVPVAVIYLAVSNKNKFRIRRTFTIAGWCFFGISFFGALRS